jgi:hypothetical protein
MNNNSCRSQRRVNNKGEIKDNKTKGGEDLQGNKIEDPDYMIEHDIKPDTLFYITNQIMKPACQFLELAIDEPEKIFNFYIIKEINRRLGKKNILNYDSSLF